ncbi:substrate-binding domain-containing protein [Pararhizobium sp. PWRC1-1]|uniref:substrate-binding domain-containing protein n=1 Tax=Pararhizobium sp. PWRC1-1 TaxID=2804566 RepID=UPI003CF15E15
MPKGASALSRTSRPKLTTVPIQQIGAGRAAADILLRLLNGETVDDIETVLPVEPVILRARPQCP